VLAQLPFHLGLALNDAQPSGVNYGANADLQGLSSLEVMDKIVKGAAERGITVMLDLHSFGPDSYLSDGMWYTSSAPEATVIQGWKKILQRYKDQWNVIAADLKNEPHAATWGTGSDSTDWNLGAARLANAIAAGVSDRFLMFVEGVTSSPSTTDPCFYGENISVRSLSLLAIVIAIVTYLIFVVKSNLYRAPRRTRLSSITRQSWSTARTSMGPTSSASPTSPSATSRPTCPPCGTITLASPPSRPDAPS
jgi:endoglucanase